MTLQDLIDYLRERAALPEPLEETVIARTLLLAYELGLEQGKAEQRVTVDRFATRPTKGRQP